VGIGLAMTRRFREACGYGGFQREKLNRQDELLQMDISADPD
jgi:hypothetical protein